MLIAGCCVACGVMEPSEPIPVSTGVIIEGFEIRNELAYPVTDVMILVPKTGTYAGCGNLMPRSACSSTFEEVDYTANALAISWKERGEPHEIPEFVVEVPSSMAQGTIAYIEVIIFASGQAGARLVRKAP